MPHGEDLTFVLSGGGSMEPCQSLANWAWWDIPTAPALRKLKQEDDEIEASLDYTETLSEEKQQQKKNGKPCRTVKPSWQSQVLYVLCKVNHMGYIFFFCK